MLHRLVHLYEDLGFHLGGVFFWILHFFCLHHLLRDDYFIGGFSLAGLNRFCNPTTALLIIITILIFIFILILSILIILIIPIILIILIILFVLIVVINSFLLPRETVAAFRFHLANPPLRLPPYPSPASFRTSPLASSIYIYNLKVNLKK